MHRVINYFKFLAHQLTGWHKASYWLFGFSLGAQVMTLVSNPFSLVSLITFIGTTLGVLCILAINQAKSVNGFLGVLSAMCFVYVGFAAKNYLSIGEQLVYMATLDLPVLLSPSWNQNMVSKIRSFTWRSTTVAVLATVVTYAISGFLIGALTNDPRPWIDAISFSISACAGVICFMRFKQQYLWWVASGIAQMILWAVSFRQGDATLAMFVNSSVYLMNDVLAFTISPWYNKKNQAAEAKKETAYFAQLDAVNQN
ncbi:nicotinamide riboside transporter PnuC [Furfurilactobacillus siliginis]|uniref:Integral membrane protein n=1 Tax=Furfurilactobacillus siliginis TaxID=348151 RepID=A0A0R2LAA5_9LACO|nr:nicotinamide riboside transporter PnuC [Furfurilactobacillus siliginis]KRN96630.1 integral membrane protein [Furfurilactobacillus siliginis]GEK28803.1 nicotinamide mononucleotide transporter [Furfurilactobacillus siliginis]